MPARRLFRIAFALSLLAGLPACTQTAVAPVAAPVAPPAAASEAAPSPVPTPPPLALPPEAPGETLKLVGRVSLPRGLGGLANAHDGIVAGAPVAVYDVATGKRLGRGNTYYDGSYEAEVPASVGKRAAIVQIDLIDATTRQPLFPLVAPLLLAPELGEQTQDVGPDTTTWVALLTRLAAQEANAPPPDWTRHDPGDTSLRLAALIDGTQPAALDSFRLFVAGSDALKQASTPAALRGAIDGLVGRLVASARPANGAGGGNASGG